MAVSGTIVLMIGKNNGIIGHKVGTVLPRPGVKSAIRQAVKLKEDCFEGIRLLMDDLRAAEEPDIRARVANAISQLVRGWDTLEDRRRILRNRGLPKSEEPSNRGQRKASLSTVRLLDNASDPHGLFLKAPISK